jgi:hypothetical protein
LEESIRNTIGKDYDPAELLVWLRKDGKQEIAWWLMELDNKTPKDGDVVKGIEAFLTLLPPRLKKWGLDLDRDIPEKLIAPIAQRVRDKAGKPVSEKTVRSWFDNPEKFYDQLTRCIGKYGARFEYSMTVPGVILETNGGPRPERRGGGMCCRPAPGKKKLAGTLGTSDIHWSFGRSYALASDHAMQVRSLASDVELQRKVFKKVPLESKESALAYRDLVAGQESLLKVLRACREKQSMTPLHDHRAGSGGEEKDRVERLLKILGQ